ncbi:hypothetical protein GCM10010191_66680 [Actinomadura vinacea]|uniref:HTH tetR-type domain-containing protein n=1 Tax=Actinomadura vinacea TaxID=115336 RepID=A0ABN3JYQ2_9ACTN
MAGKEKAPTSVWTRPERRRREQPTLSRDQIVDAALDLLDAEGLAGLSMRRLGTRLNAGATSVYWHVANKDELLELALDRVMAEVRVPDPEQEGWRAAATGYARSVRALIHRHPWTVTLFAGGPMLGPNATRTLDEILAVFEHAGFTGHDLEYAWSTLIDYVIGVAGNEASWHTGQPGVTAEEWMESLGPYLEGMDAQHPRVAAHIREIWAKDYQNVLEERFAFGLECVLNGLATRTPTP